jgi:oligopeptide transport system permease protein
VSDIIAQRFPVSLKLGLVATAVIVVVGIPLGVVSALRQRTWLDYTSLAAALIAYSLPVFVLALLLLLSFSTGLHLLPVGGWGEPRQYIIPAFAMGIGPATLVARLTRASILDVLMQDFIRTARAKGLREWTIIARHALRNALPPVVTVLGAQVSFLITGSFVVETMLAIPGLGQMFVLSATSLDYPLIMGLALFYAIIIAVMNIIVDAAYVVFNRQVKFG